MSQTEPERPVTRIEIVLDWLQDLERRAGQQGSLITSRKVSCRYSGAAQGPRDHRPPWVSGTTGERDLFSLANYRTGAPRRIVGALHLRVKFAD
jgi:hypothetical protein